MFVSEDRPSRRTTDFLVNRAAGTQGAALCYGRFLQADPLGYEDGMNMYGYVGGDPINYVDPTGLKAGDSFSTRDAAAIDANLSYFRKYGVEWYGNIYSYKGIFGSTYYYYDANRGEVHRDRITVHGGGCAFYTCDYSASWHTHNTNLKPNHDDTLNAFINGVALYTGLGITVYVANPKSKNLPSVTVEEVPNPVEVPIPSTSTGGSGGGVFGGFSGSGSGLCSFGFYFGSPSRGRPSVTVVEVTSGCGGGDKCYVKPK